MEDKERTHLKYIILQLNQLLAFHRIRVQQQPSGVRTRASDGAYASTS